MRGHFNNYENKYDFRSKPIIQAKKRNEDIKYETERMMKLIEDLKNKNNDLKMVTEFCEYRKMPGSGPVK